ncbi:MAG TPA: hypothetical protein VHW03_10065 [Chthoniobacterales bacterium]|nr:hypothetical protein [Chthoniobacterales bacterium]
MIRARLELLLTGCVRATVTGVDDEVVIAFTGRRESVLEALRRYWPEIVIEDLCNHEGHEGREGGSDIERDAGGVSKVTYRRAKAGGSVLTTKGTKCTKEVRADE